MENFEIRETTYGLGLFYIGDETIPVGKVVISEMPFFKALDENKIGEITLTDCASMAYVSLQLPDNERKKLETFKVGNLDNDFKLSVFNTYKEEIKLLLDYLITNEKYKTMEKEQIKKIVISEIYRHSLYRLISKAKLVFKNGIFFKCPYEWGYCEHITRMNHSCEPNLKINDIECKKVENGEICGDGSISFTSIKPINKGDELTFSYFDDPKTSLLKYGFNCGCEKCKKTDGHWKKSKRRSKKKSKRKLKSKKKKKMSKRKF